MPIGTVGVVGRHKIGVEHIAKEMLIVVFGCALANEDAMMVPNIHVLLTLPTVARLSFLGLVSRCSRHDAGAVH
jgi:hypothetical protein